MIHIPVLKKEVLKYLGPKPNENFIDGTVGEGGHAEALLKEIGPNGKVLGIDLDPLQISKSQWMQSEFQGRIILANDSYVNLKRIAETRKFQPVNGILLDLGMSSAQLEKSEKGFSFKQDQALDMRYNDQSNFLTAAEIVNEWTEEKIEKILREFGEEKFSKKIAKAISETRKSGRIKTTNQLMGVIGDAVPAFYKKGKIHFATRTFQALRIAVNGELENVKIALPEALATLEPGGRLAVISFHSLEDRIVKNFFRDEGKNGRLKILTKKPVMAGSEEKRVNPRSRSAKLRAAIKI